VAGVAWSTDDVARLERLAEEGKNQIAIAALLGRTEPAVRLKAQKLGLDLTHLKYGEGKEPRRPVTLPNFEVADLPDELPTADELLERREKQFARTQTAKEARKLIPVRINLPGPIGIAHQGDTHLDDNGTDIATVRRHVELFGKTEGLYAGNVGDYQNNWIGRLAHLHAQQSISARESWVLVEWLIRSVRWLALIGGNHDLWSGTGDPIKWIAKQARLSYESNGMRLGLTFPNGRVIRLNARHDFRGRSQYDAAFGPAKAARFGYRDHILTAGHTHQSGYHPLCDPATGLISHAIRIASYKTFDRFAEEKGFLNEAFTCAPVTIIDPEQPDDSTRCVTVIFDPEEGAEYLTWKRKRWARKRV
jgi:hypothetical protein